MRLIDTAKGRGEGGVPGSPARGRIQDFEFPGPLRKKRKNKKSNPLIAPHHMVMGLQPNTYPSNSEIICMPCQYPWQLRPYICICSASSPSCAADRRSCPRLASVPPVGSGKCSALKPPQPARHKYKLPGLFLIQSKSATLPARIKWKGNFGYARFAPRACILAACACL